MTHFEYIAAAYTLILTFSAARILAGIPHAINRERFYWVHVSWLFSAIMFCLTEFWGFWAYRDVEWTLPRLVLVLASPAFTYMYSSLLAPADPSNISTWKEYFFSVRLPFFISGILLGLSAIFSNLYLLDISAIEPDMMGLYVVIVFFTIGALSNNERLHTIIAFWPPVMIIWIFIEMAPPDWFIRQ